MKIYKKSYLLVLGILLIVIVAIFFIKTNNLSDGKRPNLILISVDSLRADHVSSYGYSRKTTPNIDNLAKEGMLFKNYISQAYLTPISEMAVHTGLYPSSSGVSGFDAVLPKNFFTLAQILKVSGYKTAAFGNSPEFVIYPALKDNFDRGFDLYDIQLYREKLVNQKNIFNFLNKEKDKPFFLWLPLGSAHHKYGKFPKKFGDLTYKESTNELGTNWFDKVLWIYNNVLYEFKDENSTKKANLNNKDIQYIIDRYDDDIFATDKWIGDFLAQLKNTGLDENTIVVVQSEHGEDFGEHGYIWHYDIFDTTLKTPLIIKNPTSNKKNLVIENQVQSIDLLPTILDFLNIAKPHQIEGSSLVLLAEGKKRKNNTDYIFVERTPLWERVMFQFDDLIKDEKVLNQIKESSNLVKKALTSYYKDETIDLIQGKPFFDQKDVALRTNNWKLIYRRSKDFQEKYSWWNVLSGSIKKMEDFELYNLKSDPAEQENVIEKYPDVAKDLKQKINNFIKKQESKKIIPELKKPIQEYF